MGPARPTEKKDIGGLLKMAFKAKVWGCSAPILGDQLRYCNHFDQLSELVAEVIEIEKYGMAWDILSGTGVTTTLMRHIFTI